MGEERKIETHSVMTAEELFEMGITVPEPKAPRATGERVRVRIEFTSSPEVADRVARYVASTGATDRSRRVSRVGGDDGR